MYNTDCKLHKRQLDNSCGPTVSKHNSKIRVSGWYRLCSRGTRCSQSLL